MTTLRSLLPKIAVFAVSVLIGVVVANVVVGATADRTPQSHASTDPDYVLAGADTPAGPGPLVAFTEQDDPSAEPAAIATLAPVDLEAAAATLLGGDAGGQGTEPAVFRDPTGFPRIHPITQFDGGPLAGSNCTLASGSMLARLAFGIVTNGSTLRTLQDDQVDGTGLNDLAQALWRGYGVTAPTGLLKPQQLKNLLASGYGAVIQGVYGEIPTGLRLQRNFTGGHAIYLDGYYPGNAKRGIPEAYYVIDPLGRPKAGYKGEWWPASIVDRFALAFGGGRIPAMWAFPPGGVPPEVVGPDVVPIPPDPPDTPDPTPTPTPTASGEPSPSASVEPTATPTATPTSSPGGPGPGGPWLGTFEAGDLVVSLAPPDKPPVDKGGLGGLILVPVFDICLVTPGLPGCPSGLEAVFPAGEPPILQLPPGPDVKVVFVDSDRANEVIVGFTVDPPAPADVKFWVQGLSPAAVGHASAMSSIDLFGSTIILARLDVKAATTYGFQAVAGSGLLAGTSEVGTFTTGSGVEEFDVALAQEAAPVFRAGTGLSPYSHLADKSFLRPMIKLEALGGTACEESADFGGTGYCLDQVDLGPLSSTCTVAKVSYVLAGIDSESVAVRAFPAVAGETPEGDLTLDGVLEATGPAGTGAVSVGCLGSGMTYHVVIDAIGDDRGALASETVTVP